MNPVPRTAIAFLFATLLSASTYPMLSSSMIAVIVALSCCVVALAIGANVKEIRTDGKSVGFTGGRVLPIAGLNFATVFTFIAVLIGIFHGISQVHTA